MIFTMYLSGTIYYNFVQRGVFAFAYNKLRGSIINIEFNRKSTSLITKNKNNVACVCVTEEKIVMLFHQICSPSILFFNFKVVQILIFGIFQNLYLIDRIFRFLNFAYLCHIE